MRSGKEYGVKNGAGFALDKSIYESRRIFGIQCSLYKKRKDENGNLALIILDEIENNIMLRWKK